MAIKTRTTTQAVHRTIVTAEGTKNSGGRDLLLETHDLIHSEKNVGQLTVQYGVGGCISSVVFEERETIAQKDIEFPALSVQ
jgi:hypothetical protein